jgi:hypothetical protein
LLCSEVMSVFVAPDHCHSIAPYLHILMCLHASILFDPSQPCNSIRECKTVVNCGRFVRRQSLSILHCNCPLLHIRYRRASVWITLSIDSLSQPHKESSRISSSKDAVSDWCMLKFRYSLFIWLRSHGSTGCKFYLSHNCFGHNVKLFGPISTNFFYRKEEMLGNWMIPKCF